MRVIPGLELKFIQTASLRPSDMEGKSEAQSRGGQLYDLFVPATTANCPHPSIRNRPDGHNTGDLFEEVDGLYAFREFLSRFVCPFDMIRGCC